MDEPGHTSADRIAAAEKRMAAQGIKSSNPADIANAPAGPAWLEEMDRKRAAMNKGGTGIQDMIDEIMTTPGTEEEWTKRLVELSKGNIDVSEARSRVKNARYWYTRQKYLVPDGNKEKLVHA